MRKQGDKNELIAILDLSDSLHSQRRKKNIHGEISVERDKSSNLALNRKS